MFTTDVFYFIKSFDLNFALKKYAYKVNSFCFLKILFKTFNLLYILGKSISTEIKLIYFKYLGDRQREN